VETVPHVGNFFEFDQLSQRNRVRGGQSNHFTDCFLLLIAKKDVEAFMKKAGVSVDKESLDIFFKQVDGKSVTEMIAAGSKKTVVMPRCGGGGAPAAAAAGASAEAPKAEEKKEEVEEVDMGGLFGDDEDEY
jgi:large subunit ribosomal protein LP2